MSADATPPADFPASPLPDPTPAPRPGHGIHVMLVDDDPSVLNVATRILLRLGYTVTACAHPADALQRFRAAPQTIDLVVSDLTMPDITGVDLARQMLGLRPGLPFILTTGYVRPIAIDEARALGLIHFLRKPYDFETLAKLLVSALAAPGSGRDPAAK